MLTIVGWSATLGTKAMDISTLKPGDRVRTVDGALAEIVRETEDGQWILLRYLSDTDDPQLMGGVGRQPEPDRRRPAFPSRRCSISSRTDSSSTSYTRVATRSRMPGS